VSRSTGVDMAWTADAACKGMDPNLFFGPGSRHRFLPGGQSGNGNQIEGIPVKARGACAACPVRTECVTHAVATGEHGYWGGTNEDDRDAIRSRQGRRPARPEAHMAKWDWPQTQEEKTAANLRREQDKRA